MSHETPIVFLHGVPTAGSLWDGVRAALPERESLAPDLPGFGGEAPLPDPSVGAYLDWLEKKLDGVVAPDLVGNDYGALLALGLAQRRTVRSIVLTSTTLGVGWLPSRVTALPPLHLAFYRWHEGRRWLARAVGSADRDRVVRAFPPAPGLASTMEGIARHLPLRKEPPPPDLPTLCLWGEADRNFPLSHGRRLAGHLGAELELLHGLHHLAMWEDPERYAGAVRAFWNRLTS